MVQQLSGSHRISDPQALARLYFKHARDLILILDAQSGVLLDANEVAREALDAAFPRLQGHPFSIIEDALGEPLSLEALKQAGGRSVVLNYDGTQQYRLALSSYSVAIADAPRQLVLCGMTPSLPLSSRQLAESELFQNNPIPLYVEDLSAIDNELRKLPCQDADELNRYLTAYPEEVARILGYADIRGVNRAALELTEAPDADDFMHGYFRFFTAESLDAFRRVMVEMIKGSAVIAVELPVVTWHGEPKVVHFAKRYVTPGDPSVVVNNFYDITQWKKAEGALRREQHALMGSPIFSFRWRNAEGWPVESVSPNIVQLGYSQDDLLTGRIPYASLVHPEDLQRVAAEVVNYSATGQSSFEQEYRLVTADGEVRWTYDYTAIVRERNGIITHYDGFIIDITSRKLAEQAQRASERRYQEMFESNAVSIWLEDISRVIPLYDALRRQGVSDFRDYFQHHPELIFELAGVTQVLDINAATLGLFEAETKAQLLGSLDKVFCAESLAGSIEVHTALAEGRRVFEVETVNQTLQGNLRHILIKMNLPEEPDYSRVLVTLVDITARKLAEERLLASEKELETIYNQLLDTYYRTDSEGILLRLSPSVEQMLGYSAEEALGSKISNYYVDPEERKVFLQKLMQSGGVLRNHISEMRHRDGHVVWCLTNARVVYDAEGQVIGVEGTTRDVSDRHQMEQELRQARDMAQQANRLKGDFLANMSHEIRTPMNGVIGFANLLSRTALDSEQRDYVETMKTSMGDLLAIVNDILDFSRIESNKLSINPMAFDLLEAVSDVVSLFSVSAAARGLELDMVVGEGVPYTVQGDPVRLRQVLGNLLGNAIKFTEQGTVGVRVSVDAAQGDDYILYFEVEDTGIGIDAEDVALLFNAFTQLNSGHAGGTGLGLAISRRLVELMGGAISVRAGRSGGSIFSFTLPVRRLHQDALAYPSDTLPTLDNHSGARVLVVDDNAINRKLITTLLGQMGVDTVEAEDGHAALACHNGDCFDLILMDIRMPGMDGVAATRQIRLGEERHRRTPIIALTAHALPHERETFILAGMDDCLTKPVREDELFNLLRHYLRKG
jgi:PAS domain S-box-containing protein